MASPPNTGGGMNLRIIRELAAISVWECWAYTAIVTLFLAAIVWKLLS